MQDSFRRQWQAQQQGVINAWNTPVIFTKDGQGANYVKWRDTNRDMEFHQFLAFLITVVCSVYIIHPEDIGMQSWAPQASTLNQPSPQARIDASRNRGFKPLMRMVANLLNRFVLWRMYPDRKYMLVWVNLDPTDEKRDLELAQMRLANGITTPAQEIALMNGDKHEFADVPVNPYHFQAWQAKNGMVGATGGPGEEEEEGGPQPEVEGLPGFRGFQGEDKEQDREEENNRRRKLAGFAGEDKDEDRARKSLDKVIEVTIDD